MKDSDLRKLASEYPFPYLEIKEIQHRFNLNLKDLRSIIEVSMKCNVSLISVWEVLKRFEEQNSISEFVFYNKELSDAVRDIVVNSPCTYDNAVKLMNKSKNYTRDVIIIKELLSKGVSFAIVSGIIINLNT